MTAIAPVFRSVTFVCVVTWCNSVPRMRKLGVEERMGSELTGEVIPVSIPTFLLSETCAET